MGHIVKDFIVDLHMGVNLFLFRTTRSPPELTLTSCTPRNKLYLHYISPLKARLSLGKISKLGTSSLTVRPRQVSDGLVYHSSSSRFSISFLL